MSKQLLKRTTLVSANTLISRILGFVRDIVLAHFFGASIGADAFFVAFRIPNFMRALFAEGAFSQAFIPVLSSYRESRSHEETRRFIDHVSSDLSAFLMVIVLFGVLMAPFVIAAFAPGFLHSQERFSLATHMLRIMFPYMMLISLTAMCSGILNTYDSFGVPSFTPVILNLTLIGIAFLGLSHFTTPIYAIAWGVLLAGFLQLFFQLPFLWRKKLFPRFALNFKDSGVKRVLKLLVPAIIGVSVVQLSLLLDTIFASFLKVGSVSWLYYSSRLMNFPLGVFGVAIATVILPKLSRHFSAKEGRDYSSTLDWSLRLLLLIAVPSAVGMWILSGPLLATLFLTGQFSPHDVIMTQESLNAFSLGIVAFMSVKVLASAFYARQDIKTPVKIAALAVIFKVIFNMILVIPLQHTGLALSTSLAAFINVFCLIYFLFQRKLFVAQAGWLMFGVRLVLASAAMAVLLWYAQGSIGQWFEFSRWIRIEYLVGLIVSAIAVYFVILWLLGLRLYHFKSSLE